MLSAKSRQSGFWTQNGHTVYSGTWFPFLSHIHLRELSVPQILLHGSRRSMTSGTSTAAGSGTFASVWCKADSLTHLLTAANFCAVARNTARSRLLTLPSSFLSFSRNLASAPFLPGSFASSSRVLRGVSLGNGGGSWFCQPDLAHFDALIWPTPSC